MRQAVRKIIEANNDFRAGMPADWDGDLLQDAIDAAAKLLLATLAPQAQTGGVAQPSSGTERALAALDTIEGHLHEMRSLKGWRLNIIRDSVHNAKAALSGGVAQAGWMPIKTAPKDRPIMLCVTGFLPCTGRWWPVDSCWASFDWEGHFESDKEMSDYVNGSSYEPTHWMPLPAGPSVSSTPRATPIDHSEEECPNFPGCHCVDQCCDGWKHPSPEISSTHETGGA